MNGGSSRAFAIERSVRQDSPLSPLLYVLALEPLLRRLRDEGKNPALRGVPFAGPLTARVSAFAYDITVFESRRLDIKAVKKAVGEYERIAGVKVKFDKSESLWLGAWGSAIPFQGPSAGVTDPSASSEYSSGLTSSWSEIGRKYKQR